MGAPVKGIYFYAPQGIPGPGTGNLAFESAFSLPIFEWEGPGMPYRGHINAMQPPQLYFSQAQTVIGLAGNGAGDLGGTSLIDMQTWLTLNGVDSSPS